MAFTTGRSEQLPEICHPEVVFQTWAAGTVFWVPTMLAVYRLWDRQKTRTKIRTDFFLAVLDHPKCLITVFCDVLCILFEQGSPLGNSGFVPLQGRVAAW